MFDAGVYLFDSEKGEQPGSIQERFFKKLAASRVDNAVAASLDRGGQVAIFELLFDGFNEEKNLYSSVLNK